MNHPKISIVTPSFNQEEFIESTIRSVVLQDYPNLEYVVVDGGSSDNSANIIKKYVDKISYWVSEPDGGHGNGLNKGFRETSGDIMGWINSDDLLTPWSLRTIAEIFTKFPHVNWIQGFTSSWNRQGQMTGAFRNPKNIYDYLTGNYAWIQQESVFWRRELWDRSGWTISEDVKLMVDGELWSRFFLSDELYTIDCVLGGWRCYGENRALKNSSICLQEMEESIHKMAGKCSEEVKHNARKLNGFLSAAKSAPLRKTIGVANAQRILSKTVASKLFKVAGYKIITWDVAQSDWIETSIPFRS